MSGRKDIWAGGRNVHAVHRTTSWVDARTLYLGEARQGLMMLLSIHEILSGSNEESGGESIWCRNISGSSA
jgi:hypothetical protein